MEGTLGPRLEMGNLADNAMSGKNRSLTLNIVFRKYDDGIVAECLEIPGCLSQGDTDEEAKANITDAINSCLAVIFEDAIKAGESTRTMDLVGIERQETVEIEAPHILQPVCA